MRTCGAPLNVHIQRLHIINCKKKTPIHMNGSFVFFLGRCFSRLFGDFKKLWVNQTLLSWAERERGLISNNGAVSMKL